jgi:MraZ protein
MFYGEYKHTIDAKGRLFIPAKLRDKLGESFILSRGFDKCVCVYPEDEWERFTAKIEEFPFAKERRVRRYFYAYSEDGSIDAQGRVTVNKDFREFANLEKDVVIIGNRNHFEIWSASAWEEEKNAFDNEDITNELIELGF